MKKILINVLQALTGDAIFLTYIGNDAQQHHILIDGGMPNTFTKSIKKHVSSIDCLDYIFITHIDRDHIGGILKLLQSDYKGNIKNIFFNSGNIIRVQSSELISENDGKELINYINESTNIKVNREEITIESKFDLYGLKIYFLSPSYEALKHFNESYSIGEIDEKAFICDTSEVQNNESLEILSQKIFIEKSLQNDSANGVSLAMLLEYADKKILLMGDAKDKIVIESLIKMGYENKPARRLKVDYLKLAHHASKFHTSNDFLSFIECHNYIISTDGSGNAKHPNIEVLARILCHPNRDIQEKIYFYFNYSKEQYENKGIRLLTSDEEKRYNCESIYDKTLFDIVS